MPTITLYQLHLARPYNPGQSCRLCRRRVTYRRLAWVAIRVPWQPHRSPPAHFYICQRCKPILTSPPS